MVILIDTNVILDFLIKREPYSEDAINIISMCYKKKVTGYLAAHTIPNLFYIMRKEFSVQQRKEMLRALCRILNVSGITQDEIVAVLEDDEFDDLEDCLQMECAMEVGAEYIVTRNLSDFVNSEIPAIEPEEFLRILAKGDK